MSLKLFIAAWIAGFPGVVAVAILVLPRLVAHRRLPVALWVAQLASIAQSAVLLAVAAWAGATLAPSLGLTAPVLAALAEAGRVSEALRPQWVPGCLGGLLGAALLCLFARYAPEPLARLQTRVRMPMAARLLYGGVTEELLMRWGLMTLFAWLLWRIWQGGIGAPSPVLMWSAIGLSAIVFGLGHLPAASALLGRVTAPLAVYIVLANAAFGLVAGWLYWRFGLESAMLAHLLAHLLAHAVSVRVPSERGRRLPEPER